MNNQYKSLQLALDEKDKYLEKMNKLLDSEIENLHKITQQKQKLQETLEKNRALMKNIDDEESYSKETCSQQSDANFQIEVPSKHSSKEAPSKQLKKEVSVKHSKKVMDIENASFEETANTPINLVSNENAADRNNNINGEMAIYIGPSKPEPNLQEIQGPRDGPSTNEADSEQVVIEKSSLVNPEGNQTPSQEGTEQSPKPEGDEDGDGFRFLLNEDGHGQFMKYWIQRPLNEREIKLAIDEMNDIHPLKDVPIEEIFRGLRCLAPILSKFRKQFQEKEEELTYDELIMLSHGHSHANQKVGRSPRNSEEKKESGFQFVEDIGRTTAQLIQNMDPGDFITKMGQEQTTFKIKREDKHGHENSKEKKEEVTHSHGHNHSKPEDKQEQGGHDHEKSEDKKEEGGHGHRHGHGHGNGKPEDKAEEGKHGHSHAKSEENQGHGHGHGKPKDKTEGGHGHGHGHGHEKSEDKKEQEGHCHGNSEVYKEEAGHSHCHSHAPGQDPLELLAKDPMFKKIPLVIVEQIVRESYNLQCMLDLERFTGSEQVIQTVVEYVWQEYDDDKNGSLDFEETKLFMQDGLLSLGMPTDHKFDEEQFRDIFAKYDEDQNGLIEKHEMIILLKDMLGGSKDQNKQHKQPILRNINQYEGTEPQQDEIKIYLEKLKQREESVQNTQNQETDLIDDFGIGVTSYFVLIKIMIAVFLFLTLLFIPVFYYYNEGGAFNTNAILSNREKFFLQNSMGNLGHSTATCLHQYRSIDEPFHIKCYKGKLTEIWHFGLMPSQPVSERKFKLDFCGNSQAPDSPHREIETCTTNFLDKEKLFETYERNCTGKTKCDFNMREFKKTDIDGNLLGLTREQAEQCIDNYASIYLQYACDFGEDEMLDHQKIGLYVTITGVMSIFVFKFALHWMRVTSDLDIIVYDMNTTSLVDFSVQVELPQEVWNNWKWYKEKNPHVKIKFKDFFKQEFEEQLQALPQVLPLKEDEPPEIKIARIQFAYDNSQIWGDLSNRAQILKNGDYEKASEIEKSINEKCQENFEDFTRPVHAFVIFESQECQERVFEYLSTSQSQTGKVTWHESGQGFKLFGNKLEVEAAPEPTDVIWENLHLDQWDIFKNWLRAYGKVLTLQLFNLVVFIAIQGLLSGVNKKYPPTLRCYAVTQIFGSSYEEVYEPLKEYAKYDKDDTLKSEGRGYYQCFCQDYYNNFADINDSEALCQAYQIDMLFKIIGENFISFATVILNLVLTTVMQSVVLQIGFKTISETNDQLCQFIFISQFINTGIIGLLSNADLEFSPLSFIPLKRRHADFTDKWYMEYGTQITYTMLIQAFMPYKTVFSVIASTKLRQILDIGFSKDYDNTRAQTIPQFIDIHAGPHTKFHVRYAFIFNSIFVCFTYGLAIPLLFPITLLTMINMYISERYLFAYYYRKPPLYGPAMHNGALKILYYAPYFMIFFGYWQLGNRQIFFNEAVAMEYAKESYNPQHHTFDYSEGVNHTLILLLMIPLCFFYRQYLKVIRRAGISCKVFKQPANIDMEWRIGDLDVDENLGNYWNCIPGQMQFRHYVQETHFQKSLGIKTVDDEALEKLRTSKRGKKDFVDLANYDPLENPIYLNKFMYQPLDRRFDNPSSDFVAKILFQGDLIENKL